MSEDVCKPTLQLKLEDRSTTFDGKDVWTDDKLGGLNNISKNLIEIIGEQQSPLTICLNGEWGSGKTFFLTRLAHEYNMPEEANCAIYYNAWQDDFLEDPLLAIICQLEKVVKKDSNSKLFATIKEAALPCLAKVGLSIAKQITKNKLGVDVDSIDLDDLTSKAEKLYDRYNELDSSRSLLRSAIANLSEASFQSTQKPSMFIIDELDRCRPAFAIELLERIKHLFCVPHLVFLVGVDLDQLGKSIQSVYGDINPAEYLHRFFDIEMKLPKANKRQFLEALWQEHKLESFLVTKGINKVSQYGIMQDFNNLFAFRNATLRQIEKCVRTYALLAISQENISISWSLLVAIAVVLKVTDASAYEKFIQMKFSLGELIDELYPGAKFEEISSGNHLFGAISTLSKIAYYRSDNSVAHLYIDKIVTALVVDVDFAFQPDIMPKCLEECAPEQITDLYKSIFIPPPFRTSEYRQVPRILEKIDTGLSLFV